MSGFFYLGLAPNSRGQNSATQTMVQVELDIYSGRPNPSWVLDSEEEEELSKRLERLAPSPVGEPRTNLGYRGLILRVSPGSVVGFQEIVCSGGWVFGYKGRSVEKFSDPERTLEWWLGQTGRTHLDEDLKTLLEQEFSAN
jgi:hypothetical protein